MCEHRNPKEPAITVINLEDYLDEEDARRERWNKQLRDEGISRAPTLT